MFNTKKIRSYFSLLSQKNPPVYFDSACSALKPTPVINSIKDYYENYPACASRSTHRLANLVSKKVSESRKTVASLISARAEEIVFTKNTTEAINLIAHSLNFKKGDKVLISDKEHNSNFLPWQFFIKTKKIKLLIFKTENGLIDPKKFSRFISENKNIHLISLNLASNLDGLFIPAIKIGKIAHQNKILFLLDASSALPHKKINVKGLNADFLTFSANKLYGPTGLGVLYIKDILKNKILSPFMFGGGTVDNKNNLLLGPEKFEAGLQNYAGIIGLNSAINFLNKIGWKEISEYESSLNSYALQKLSLIPNIKIINKNLKENSTPLISFYIKEKDSHSLTIHLDQKYNILLRSGYFCNNFYFKSYKLSPALRLSLAFYNTKEEIDYLVSSLQKLTE